MTVSHTTTDERVGTMFADALAGMQAQIARVDTKASILFGFALASLTAGTTLAVKADLTVWATGCAVLATGCVLAAIVLLGIAIRPALDGTFGFRRWACAPTAKALYWDFVTMARRRHGETEEHQAGYILTLAQLLLRKYRRVRLAVDLLGAALAFATAAAILTGLGW